MVLGFRDLAFYSRCRCQTGSREVETCSKTGGRAFKLSPWTWHGPPGHNGRVGAPAKARPQKAVRLLHSGGFRRQSVAFPIRVRVSTPTDIESWISAICQALMGGFRVAPRKAKSPLDGSKPERACMRVGFEPTVRFPVHSGMKGAQSATLPPRHNVWRPK
jgi:hypothetical protein